MANTEKNKSGYSKTLKSPSYLKRWWLVNEFTGRQIEAVFLHLASNGLKPDDQENPFPCNLSVKYLAYHPACKSNIRRLLKKWEDLELIL
jgi:hypothetical protein